MGLLLKQSTIRLLVAMLGAVAPHQVLGAAARPSVSPVPRALAGGSIATPIGGIGAGLGADGLNWLPLSSQSPLGQPTLGQSQPALEKALFEQMAQLQAQPIATLALLKTSPAPLASALYRILSHPETISTQRESLTSLVGPRNVSAPAAAAKELDKLAGADIAVRELLSSGEPSAALEEFKRRFDGSRQAIPSSDDSAVVDASGRSLAPRSNQLEPYRPADRRHSAANARILSLAERIARGITRDEGLKLVPWEPLWEGDRPTWRLVKDGGHLRVQYVPEDLLHANQEVVMAHLMQEIFRAVYSRPGLIEPDLRSNGLFRALYDAMETGRVVQKGLKERPGLAGNFSAFNQERYRDPGSEAAARDMKTLPSYLRFLEGALYESRQGQEDPRIKDPRVLEVLKNTRALREEIRSASPEEAYQLSREIWPALQKLYEESEYAAMSQKLFEKMGREGLLGPDREQNSAAGRGQLKLEDMNKQRREEIQKEIAKSLKDMTPEQRENLRGQTRDQMRRLEEGFRKTMGKSQGSPRQNPRTDSLARQLEQAASRLAKEAAEAKSQALNLNEAAGLDAQAGRLRRQTDRLQQSAQEFRQLAERLEREAASAAAEKTREQARRLAEMGEDLQRQADQFREQAQKLEKQLDQSPETSSSRRKAAGIEQLSKEIADKAGKIQEEARKAQALSEALSQQMAQAPGSQAASEPSQEPSTPSGQPGQDDPLGPSLKAGPQQKAPGVPEQSGGPGDSQGQTQGSGGEIAPSGARGASDPMDDIQDGKAAGSQGASETSQGPSTPGGEPGQDDPLARLLEAWSQQNAPGNPGQAGESGDSQGQVQDSGGGIDPAGTQGTSDSMGEVQDKIERIKSGGLDAGQRNWLDQYLEPVRGMIDTLAYKIRKHVKTAALGRDLNGLFEGDVDEDALPYYKAKIGIMKEELLPGRPKSRITVLLDLSGSMGRIGGGDSLDHAARALLMALKAFKLAFRNEPGVEVRVVAYNENPQLPIIGAYLQAKDLSDAALYKAIERINEIQNGCRGNNCGARMMDQAVQDIRENMKGHPDTTYALLHIGDGDPGADIESKIRAIYDDPANAKIRFANLAAGPRARDMYDKYQPYSFWARELSELGTSWVEIVESTFKKSWRRSR